MGGHRGHCEPSRELLGGGSDPEGTPVMDPIWDRDIVGAELGTPVPQKWLEQGHVSLLSPNIPVGLYPTNTSVGTPQALGDPQGVLGTGKNNPRGPNPCRRAVPGGDPSDARVVPIFGELILLPPGPSVTVPILVSPSW